MRRVLSVALLVTACGGASPPPAVDQQRASRREWEMCAVGDGCVPCADGDETTPRCQLLLGALVSSDETASSLAPPVSTARSPSQPSSPPPPPRPPLPLARTDRSVTTNDPALAAATIAYGRLVASPFSLESAPADTAAGIHELIGRIQRASIIVEDVSQACAPIEAVPSVSRVAALVLHADASDYLASHVRRRRCRCRSTSSR